MRPKSITVSGQSETERLIECVNQNGLKKAAEAYGTNMASLSRWVRSQGYQLRRTYVLVQARKEVENVPQNA